ncbi:MAG: LytTR family transcriptional regulator [Opitutales bacterium]|nr:LytTR family transcriptional regulator [Opitutales bacterium]
MKYPRQRSPKEILGYSLKIGLFVAAFLVLYKPFGLNELTGKYRNLIIAGYGLPCMLPMVAQGFSKQWLLNRFSFTERWTVGHELLLTLPMLLLIGLCNSIYTILVSRTAFSGGVILQMELYTVLIGIFPCSGVIALEMIRQGRMNQTLARGMNERIEEHSDVAAESGRPLLLQSESESDALKTTEEELCFIKAGGNYIEVTHCRECTKPETTLLRLPLKEAEQSLLEQGITMARCHRSYLVNAKRIARVQGNAQGLILHLDRGELTVPVSRSFVSDFRK